MRLDAYFIVWFVSRFIARLGSAASVPPLLPHCLRLLKGDIRHLDSYLAQE